MDSLSVIITWVSIILVSLMVVALILSKLYRRASKEIAFVRTGLGGQKVIMNGGAIVLPVMHETILVNMNTLRLEVRRANEQALITRDRMRVDVTAEFYVRVKPLVEAIADAAQTLGRRTLDTKALKELIEGKFVDALRAVAAEMAMEELHEQRVQFVQKVQAAVSEDLLKNGLELESVSLTALDQTNRDYFNPQNAFDAEGLTRLTEEIESRRKQRNDIERDTELKISQKDLETEREKLNINREEQYARMMQVREVEVKKAAEASETQVQQAEKKRVADEAEITAKQQVDLAHIQSERMVEESRIEKERLLKEREIERQRAVESADIEKDKSVKLADQDRQIAIAEKSKAQSLAQSEAEQARSKAVKASEEVETVKETEIANRLKQIELIKSAQDAEKEAIKITVAAEADKKAALDKAEAVKTEAEAAAEKERITSKGKADAEKMLAEAAELKYKVEAEGKRALNEAENILTSDVMAMQIKKAIIENLSDIVASSVKPLERIDDIKIYQVGGLGNNGGDGSAKSGSGEGNNLADQVVNSALRYRGQAPLIDSIMREIGMVGSDINGLTAPLNNQTEQKSSDEKSDEKKGE
ncbi:MAG: flotillin family protein [Melioribacteraceae bacterium]|nr:MAG: flotillin family protein [Melioribacteraceae bacterium]